MDLVFRGLERRCVSIVFIMHSANVLMLPEEEEEEEVFMLYISKTSSLPEKLEGSMLALTWLMSCSPWTLPAAATLTPQMKVLGPASESGRRGSNRPDWSRWERWTQSGGLCLWHTTWVTHLKWNSLWEVSMMMNTWGRVFIFRVGFPPVIWTCPCQAQYM